MPEHSDRLHELDHQQSLEHLDRQLDQAIEDTFPTSDPVSLTMPPYRPARWRSPFVRSLASVLPLVVVGGIILGLWWHRAGD